MQKLFGKDDVICEPMVKEEPVEIVPPTIQPRSRVNYFVTKKGKYVYDLNGTSLAPSKKTMLGGKFKEKYRRQIENILFNGNDDIDPDNILPLLLLNEYINSGVVPIRLVMRGYSKLLVSMVEVLNDYFNEHKAVVDGIYNMFKQTTELPSKDKENGTE